MAYVVGRSVSDAWLKAVRCALGEPKNQAVPLVVEIRDVRTDSPDDRQVRAAVNKLLRAQGKAPVETVADTIFPYSLWKKSRSAQELFERYLRMIPKLRRYPKNRKGTYFERLINYPGVRGELGKNQLAEIIDGFRAGTTRRSALQATLFCAATDHTRARYLAFPCLQHVWFGYRLGEKKLSVTGVYALHYLFERAYGNYLGLLRLGEFVAHYLGFTVDRVVCVASVGQVEGEIRRVKDLVSASATDEYERDES